MRRRGLSHIQYIPPSPPPSDDADGDEPPTSPISPIAQYPRVPRSRNQHTKSRAPEFYGFVAWLSTSVAWVLFLVWALCPDEWIQAAGVEWYPSREWAILLPAWSVMLFVFAYIIYSFLAVAAVPSFSDLSSITDSRAHILKHSPSLFPETAATKLRTPFLAFTSKDAVPAPYDVPIGLVNAVIYGKRKRNRRVA